MVVTLIAPSCRGYPGIIHGGHTGTVPELPEVTALVADLGARLTGRTVDRLDVLSFAVLKTFDPAPSALAGRAIVGVTRHGKFVDITFEKSAADDIHLVMHLALAGWIAWRDGPPPAP